MVYRVHGCVFRRSPRSGGAWCAQSCCCDAHTTVPNARDCKTSFAKFCICNSVLTPLAATSPGGNHCDFLLLYVPKALDRCARGPCYCAQWPKSCKSSHHRRAGHRRHRAVTRLPLPNPQWRPWRLCHQESPRRTVLQPCAASLNQRRYGSSAQRPEVPSPSVCVYIHVALLRVVEYH